MLLLQAVVVCTFSSLELQRGVYKSFVVPLLVEALGADGLLVVVLMAVGMIFVVNVVVVAVDDVGDDSVAVVFDWRINARRHQR